MTTESPLAALVSGLIVWIVWIAFNLFEHCYINKVLLIDDCHTVMADLGT